MAEALLLTNVAATWVMVGLIWFVQVVHYPLFARVGTPGFAGYADAHSRLTTFVVGPPMLVEAGSAVLLLGWRPAGLSTSLVVAGIVLVAVVWLTTAALSVPRHRALGDGWDEGAHRALVATNWVRTAAWTARGAIAVALLAQAL